MIDYNKLFLLLDDRSMKRTDLLQIMSSQTLAKLGKNEIVKSDIIDRVCLFLGVQPSEIMEVYEIHEVDGRPIKAKLRGEDAMQSYDATYKDLRGITVSELKYVLDEQGRIDIKKLDDLIVKAHS